MLFHKILISPEELCFTGKRNTSGTKNAMRKKHNQEILNQELLEFTKKFMNKLSKDIDNHIPSSKAEIYSFLNILKNLPQVKQYETSKSTKHKTKRQLTPEIIEKIKKEILGMG